MYEFLVGLVLLLLAMMFGLLPLLIAVQQTALHGLKSPKWPVTASAHVTIACVVLYLLYNFGRWLGVL